MAKIFQFFMIKAPVATVYKNLTEQAGLAAWWTDKTEAKPEVGAILKFHFGPDYHKEIKVIALEPNKKVEWECLVGDPEWMDTKITFDLEEKDGKTHVHFTHDGWKDYSHLFARCSFDWSGFMRSLRDLSEGKPGQPYKN